MVGILGESFGACMLTSYRFLVVVLTLASTAVASDIYVDNSSGRDGNDGQTLIASDGNTGPVYSLERAAQLAQFGDVIVLMNTGKPYYGSLSLTGDRHSGTANRPFVVEGNGAIISGLRSVPHASWHQEGHRLWKLTLTRKGYYRLRRNGQTLPEEVSPCGCDPRLTLKPGHWAAWQGSLYFRQDGVDRPESQNFAYAADQTGISLHQVNHVLITNVTLQHFRFDGLHAQGLCDHIVLENVNAVENGRAGVVSSGASRLKILGGRIGNNGRHQLLVLDRSTAKPDNCDIREIPEPQVISREPETR